MKRLILLVLALCMVSSCASAFGSTEDNIRNSYNSAAKSFGADMLDQYTQIGAQLIFPCEGYDVVFFLKANGDIESAGVRLMDQAKEGNFFTACMSMIFCLGDLDYQALGYLAFQFGQLKAGTAEPITGVVGYDQFSMRPGTGDIRIVFAYVNKDLKAGY